MTPDVPTVGDLADTPAPSPAEPVSAGDPVGGDADGPSSPTAATTRDDQTDYWQYGGYSPSGDAWLCPRDDCEFGVAGLLAPSCTDDGCDIDPVREHLYQHSLQDEYERITDEAAGGDAYGTLRPSDLSALVAVIREGFESIVDLFDSPAVVSPASSGAFPTTGTRGCGTAPEVAR
ncbi:MAG: hypothetical protein FWF28_07210 [Micrococcales bacterium]|nr:hypothetical protein [Micrococcales bacterium]